MDRLPLARRPGPLVLTLLAASVAAPSPAAAQAAGPGAPDPFAPGERWSFAAEPANPWIPTSVAFAARGELVLGLVGYSAPGLQVHAAGSDGLSLLHAAALEVGTQATGSSVVADPLGELALTLTQVPATGPGATPGSKTTRVVAWDVELAAAGGGLVPRWTHDPGFATHSAGLVAVAPRTVGPFGGALDSGRAVLGLRDDATGLVHLEHLDLATGALLSSATSPGGLLRGLAVSQSAERVALSAGDQLAVLDAAGSVLHAETLAGAAPALALSADGTALITGGPGLLRVLREGAGGYSTSATVSGAPSELAVRAALSADGSTLGVAWWNQFTGTSLRFEQWSADGLVRHHAVQLDAAPGGPQLWPSALALTHDGDRVLFGTWGAGDSGPELLLYDRDEAAPRLSLDTGGSAMAAALDPGGTRVAAALKSTHAGTLGTTGDVRLFDTGERDLQVLGAPTLGGDLHLVHRAAGNLHSLFLLGQPAGAGLTLPGVAGELLLAPTGLVWFAAPADALGRADLVLPLPADPGLAGLQPAFQALALTAGEPRWSDTLARPWLSL